jgi:hypothetical protein
MGEIVPNDREIALTASRIKAVVTPGPSKIQPSGQTARIMGKATKPLP